MKVIISNRAKNDITDIKYYVVNKWGWKVFEAFYNKLNATIDLIKDGVVVHQYYEDTQYKKVLITEHNTLIYYIENDILYLVTILNNFKDPNANYDIVKKNK